MSVISILINCSTSRARVPYNSLRTDTVCNTTFVDLNPSIVCAFQRDVPAAYADEERREYLSSFQVATPFVGSTKVELEKAIKEKVLDISTVTDVYDLAYKVDHDVQKELQDAVNMWLRSTTAADHLSPSLEFVVLQPGSKTYGNHLKASPGVHYSVPSRRSPAFKATLT